MLKETKLESFLVTQGKIDDLLKNMFSVQFTKTFAGEISLCCLVYVGVQGK